MVLDQLSSCCVWMDDWMRREQTPSLQAPYKQQTDDDEVHLMLEVLTLRCCYGCDPPASPKAMLKP